jgi:hypothetical protein
MRDEEFATRYRLPIGTLPARLRAGPGQPDAPGRAYLTVITCKPEMVREALEQNRRSSPGWVLHNKCHANRVTLCRSACEVLSINSSCYRTS